MDEIKTKAEMMRQFHKTMKTTCEHCKHATRCTDELVWCHWHHAGVVKYNDSYCQDWDER